jgi:hypothetical protein
MIFYVVVLALVTPHLAPSVEHAFQSALLAHATPELALS